MGKQHSTKLLAAIKNFEGTKYSKTLDKISEAYVSNDFDKFDTLLEKLPSSAQLLETLIDKLKKKSVYSGLKKILEGKDQSDEQALISISSLITHIGIEVKETNREYKQLLPDLYTKLGVLIKKV